MGTSEDSEEPEIEYILEEEEDLEEPEIEYILEEEVHEEPEIEYVLEEEVEEDVEYVDDDESTLNTSDRNCYTIKKKWYEVQYL